MSCFCFIRLAPMLVCRRWRIILLLFSLVALCPWRHSASAALLYEESFDYAANESINGKSGGKGFLQSNNGVWNRPAQFYSDQITDQGLAFKNLVISGNALSSHVAGGADNDGHQSIRSHDPLQLSDGSSYWFSFLIKLNAIPQGDDISDFEGYAALMPTSRGYSLKVGVFQGGSSIGIASSIGTSPIYSSGESIVVGHTYFVVVNVRGDGNVALFIDPTPGGDQSLNQFKVGEGILELPDQFSRLGVFSTGEGADWIFDEFRMGTSYLDVAPIPEPTSFAFLLIAGGATLLISSCTRRRPPALRNIQ